MVEGVKRADSSEEFARYAKAERQFCDEAGPVLDEIIRSIESRLGVCITEARITIDWSRRPDSAIMANCTIVRAHGTQPEGDGSSRSGRLADPPGHGSGRPG